MLLRMDGRKGLELTTWTSFFFVVVVGTLMYGLQRAVIVSFLSLIAGYVFLICDIVKDILKKLEEDNKNKS